MGTTQLLSVPYAMDAKSSSTATDAVKLTGDQTVAGNKTFSSTISGNISGNAGTVTNGVYTTGNQTVGGVKTFSSTIIGNISGNAGTVTNGVYITGNQTIAGNKTFTGTTTVITPVNPTDVANKAYVDNMLSIIQNIQSGVRDIDGNTYKVILIANQLWMAENLKTTKYNDGTAIPNITDNTAWAAFNVFSSASLFRQAVIADR